MKNANWENWVNFVLGIWIFFSPWTLVHNLLPSVAMSASWNGWIVGAAMALSANAALRNLKPWEEWVNLVLGIWLVLSPWTLGYYGDANLTWNSVVVGAIVTLLSALALPIAQKMQHQRL